MAKTKKKANPIPDAFNVWIDHETEKQMTHAEFIKHLKDDRGIDPEKLKAKRLDYFHADYVEYSTTTRCLEIEGRKYTNDSLTHRAADDMMRWA